MKAEELTNAVAVAMTRLLKADRYAVETIINNRVPVLDAVLCVPEPFIVGGTHSRPTLGALGLVNGVLQMAGANRISGHYSETGVLEGFWPCDADGKPVPRQDGEP